MITPSVIAPAAPPAAHPTWYAQRIGRLDRGVLSATGDVDLFAGHTFPTSFDTFEAARQHASLASAAAGAVAVLQHDGRFFLTRAYNAQLRHFRFVLEQTQLAANAVVTRPDSGLRALVDGDTTLRFAQQPGA